MGSIGRFNPDHLRGPLALLFAAAIAGRAPAAPDPSAIDGVDEPPRFTFDFKPTLWMPRLLGDSRFGAGQKFDVDEELSLRDLEPSFVGELLVQDRSGRRFQFSGFDFSVDDRGTARTFIDFGSVNLAPGDPFKAEFEMTSVAAEVALPWLDRFSADGTSGIRLSPLVGTRIIDLRQSIEEIGVAEQEETSIWVAPYAGLELEVFHRRQGDVPWGERVALRAGGAIGPALGGDGGSMSQVRASMSVDLTETLTAQLGFKLIWLDIDDGDYEFDGSLQGIFLGMSWRF